MRAEGRQCCIPWGTPPSEMKSRRTLKEKTLANTENESRSVVSNSLRSHGLYSPRNSLVQTTGVGSLSLLQGSNPGLSHCRWILYQLSHKGSPRTLGWVAYPFSSGSARPRNRTGVFWIAGGFFTSWVTRALFPVLYNKTLLLVAYLFKVIIDILHAFRLYHFQIVHKRAVFRERFL